MNDDAFIRAILADPDDDAPRLIYADWLDEHGQEERAEFIKVQIALAKHEMFLGDKFDGMTLDDGRRYDFCPDGINLAALRRRERELLRGPRPDLYDLEVCWFHQGDGTDTWRFLFRPQWHRGFVHSLTCATGDWLTHTAAILARQPVREVTLTTWPSADWIAGVLPLSVARSSGMRYEETAQAALKKCWRGIVFHLPPMIGIFTPSPDYFRRSAIDATTYADDGFRAMADPRILIRPTYND